LASYAEKYGGYKDIKIYKNAEAVTFEEPPIVVGVSSVTQNFEIAKKLVKNIKEKYPETIVVLGGIHVSLMPLSAPIEADYIVIREGEATFLELLNHIFKKQGKIYDIKGLFYKKDGKFVFTGERELIRDLDTIPFPKVDEKYIKSGSAHMFTSRGCPYKCPFCSSSQLWKRVRYHSADYVIKEMEMLINKYKVKHISFMDDLIITHRPRLKEICKKIRKRGWHKKISIGLHARANMVDQELVDLLKSINTIDVGIGLETGSARMLKIMKGGNVSLEQNYRAVKLFQDAGINVIGYFMIGYPGETVKDIEETIEFIKKTRIAKGQTSLSMPFPGTELWNIAKSKGIVSEDMNWDRFQADFEKNPREAIVVSDLDRKTLLKKYLQYREIWLEKVIQNHGGLVRYVKNLNHLHLRQLILQPHKIPYSFKVLIKFVFPFLRNN
jgi:radical SAM superfamily enzyme YgiQ (UPF0313 family)